MFSNKAFTHKPKKDQNIQGEAKPIICLEDIYEKMFAETKDKQNFSASDLIKEHI